ncbi:MAG: hypothetical protein ACI91K_002098, partial [Flavobacteriales bacterium]
GLVHISALSHTFVEDPSKVVKAGDIVKVKVMDVDPERKRIALSMRLDDEASEHEQAGSSRGGQRQQNNGGGRTQARPKQQQKQEPANTLGSLFDQVLKK